MTQPDTSTEVTIAEIAALTAWARRLTNPRHGQPTEHAAYQAAKTTLLGRLTDRHANPNEDDQ